MPREWRISLHAAREPGVLAVAGVVLLLCAPVFPGLSRLVVLPALLLAPGYALLRLLGQVSGPRSISVAVPVSLVLAICASLILDVTGVRLSPLSLGLLLGAMTALFLAGSYARELAAGEPQRQATPSADQDNRPPRRPSGDLLHHRAGRQPLSGGDVAGSARQ